MVKAMIGELAEPGVSPTADVEDKLSREELMEEAKDRVAFPKGNDPKTWGYGRNRYDRRRKDGWEARSNAAATEVRAKAGRLSQ